MSTVYTHIKLLETGMLRDELFLDVRVTTAKYLVIGHYPIVF